MSNILVCGLCPLPFENTRQNYGPGIRTWQFAHSLAATGCRVHLVAMKIPNVYEVGEAVGTEELEGISIERVTDTQFLDHQFIAEKIDQIRPDAVVGATIYGSFALAQAEPSVPFWADQFGHVMAEAQAKAFLDNANWPLAHFWRMVEPVVRRADHISTVSERQRFAAIGELGALGRLTAETCQYDFIRVIPCALIPDALPGEIPVLRGDRVPDDAFLVLWSGGFNVWTDVDTLFHGVERAMRRNSRIHFASTGGRIEGHDDETYAHFESLVRGSELRRRFHLEGWVRSELVPSYVEESDLGVLTERPIYEGLLGSKNRIIQWMGVGLPVAYNRIGDLGDLLATRNLGLTFEVGHVEGLARQILWASEHPEELNEMARRAKDYTEEQLTFAVSTESLCAWAESPSFAPDHELRSKIRTPADHAAPHQKLAETARKSPALRRSARLRRTWSVFVRQVLSPFRRLWTRLTPNNPGS